MPCNNCGKTVPQQRTVKPAPAVKPPPCRCAHVAAYAVQLGDVALRLERQDGCRWQGEQLDTVVAALTALPTSWSLAVLRVGQNDVAHYAGHGDCGGITLDKMSGADHWPPTLKVSPCES